MTASTPYRRGRLPSGPARLLAVVLSLVALAGCGTSDAAEPDPPPTAFGAQAPELRLGYFANLTHLSPMLGVANGSFQDRLGPTELETALFRAGPAVIEALVGGGIDAAFIGPSPALNSYIRSSGDTLRIVAGATANGASLVVRPGMDTPEDLRGTTLATPQLGGTQDVALRAWLLEHGLLVDTTGGEDVQIASQENAFTLELFRSGEVDGGWLPEPWASRLILEAGAVELLDEADLWEGGLFPSTVLIVDREYLQRYPGTVARLIEAHLAQLDAIAADPEQAELAANDVLAQLTGKRLRPEVLDRAFDRIEPTADPLAAKVAEFAADAVSAGVADGVPDLSTLFDLRILNQLLTADGKDPVSAAGLGQDKP